MKSKLVATGCFLSLGSFGCGAGSASSDLEVASQEHAVQTVYAGNYTIVREEADEIKARSTGVIRFTNSEGRDVSCGATFISPHYAITAAHCVAVKDITINTETFSVEEINASAVPPEDILEQAVIEGTGPDFSHGATLSEGYSVKTRTCVVTRRCHAAGTHGRDNCNDVFINEPTVNQVHDLALIRCDNRPLDADWVVGGAASQEELNDNVEIWWFHEIVHAMTTDDGIENHDSFEHYTRYDQGAIGRTQNWHYLEYHQMLPLLSRKFAGTNGPAYRITPPDVNLGPQFPNETWSDIPICHGTSGSGVFAAGAGTTNVLGPVVHGSFGMAGLLCHDPSRTVPGVAATSHPKTRFTTPLTTVPEVLADRKLAT